MKIAKLETIAIADLNFNGVQPTWRTRGKHTMSVLSASIQARGLLNPPCAAKIGGKWFLIDGHRRTTACLALGMTKIQCRTVEANSIAEAESLFAEVDRCTLKQGGKDRLYGWAHASDREQYMASLRPSQSGILRSFVKIFGEKDAAELADKGTNPGIAQSIYQLQRFIRTHFEAPTYKVLGLWILKHRGTDVVNALVRTGNKAEARRVLACINGDKPMRFRKAS